jgi:HlyD family secretion protein
MKRKTKIQLSLGVACAALLSLGLMFSGDGKETETFNWDAVSRGDLRETIQASGEIQAKMRINLGTNSAGEIKAIHVKDGQNVRAGEPLVTIDQVRVKQQLVQAQAMLNAARTDAERLEVAKTRALQSAVRIESLFKQGLVADEDYRQAKLAQESAELTYASAKANVAQNQANVAGIQDGLDKTTIVAPISGRVTALIAQLGEMAIPGTSNLPGATLMVISDMNEINAEIMVNESEVVRLRTGQPVQVTVESLPGRVFLGKVYEIASTAEQAGQNANMYNVKVSLDTNSPDANLLRPGMSARGVILTSHVKNAVRVPLQAVLERDGTLEEALKKGLFGPESRAVVMVVNNGRSEERTVTTGIANTQFYQITGGLRAGDKVLTGPSRKLRELKDDTRINLRRKSDTDIEQEARKRRTEES